MSQNQDLKTRLARLRYKLLLNLLINALLPLIVYGLLRPVLPSDAAALAVAGAIPAVRTLGLWLWRRRVDWIGAFAVLGFAFALAVTLFLNGNALLLKVHGSMLTGTVGLVLLVSAILGKPLLLPVLQALGRNGTNGSSFFDEPAGMARQKRIMSRISVTTAVIGLALFADMVAHVILALTLSTTAYLGASRLVTLAVLGGGLALLWLTRRGRISQAGS